MIKIIILICINLGVYKTIDYQKPANTYSPGLRTGEIVLKNPSSWILLIDDDGGDYDNPQGDTLYPDLQSYFKEALDIYYPGQYDIYEIKQNGPGPDTSILKNYEVVIWYTGECWNSAYWSTLEPQDEQNLAIYLDTLQGKLLFTSQDYFYDRYPNAGNFYPGQFPYDYLGLQYVNQDTIYPFGGIFQGVSGTVFENFSGYFSGVGVYSEGVPCWLDHILSYDAICNLKAMDSAMTDTINVGFQRNKGRYKVIYSNLGFEVISDLNIRADMIHAAIEWLKLSIEEKKFTYNKYIKFSNNRIYYSFPNQKETKIFIYDITGRIANSFSVSGKGCLYIKNTPGNYILKGQNIKIKGFIIR